MTMPADAESELRDAVALLEHPHLAVRLASFAGRPLEHMVRVVPPLNHALQRTLRSALMKCLTIAIESQEADEAFEPSGWVPKTLTGLTGGIGGLFGMLALPLEVPLTTMLMLRAIVDIARHHGEDLSSLEPRLACLQVLALGSNRTGTDAAVGYLASRTALIQLTRDVVSALAERTIVDASAPVVTRLVSEVASRFGLVWSERSAAAAVPVLGALGGVTLNVLFMDHFERVARGHFTVRRLEREFGPDIVSHRYRIISTGA